ncbi:MAG: ABC transporter permease [Solirubrobacterales bacterium]|nr:ABC transporter permease [Solirubrobacterales bacterium]
MPERPGGRGAEPLAYSISDRRHLTPAEVLSDTRVLAGRQLRKVLRRPMYVVFLFIQPVLFVLLFRYVFGGAINTGHLSYVNYLMPGIIVMTATFGSMTTGLGLTEDMAGGVVDRLRSLPISHAAILIGRTAADMVTNLVTLVVMIGIGLLVGFRPSQPIYDFILAVLLTLAFAYVFSWISAWVGLASKNPETAQSVGFIWVFPLVFASSAFTPTTHMVAPVKAFANVNPITLLTNAARDLMVGGHSATAPALWALVWMVGLLLLFVPLAVRQLRRA